MTMPLDALEAQVLNLPQLQRSQLLDRLITSLETDPEIQSNWGQSKLIVMRNYSDSLRRICLNQSKY